jgi:hypothetical protein
MAQWIASGRVLDLIVAGMLLEGAALLAVWRFRGRGVAPGDLLPNLFAGICILLAMRAGLAGLWWPFMSTPLLAALVLHVSDLRRRWRNKP